MSKGKLRRAGWIISIGYGRLGNRDGYLQMARWGGLVAKGWTGKAEWGGPEIGFV